MRDNDENLDCQCVHWLHYVKLSLCGNSFSFHGFVKSNFLSTYPNMPDERNFLMQFSKKKKILHFYFDFFFFFCLFSIQNIIAFWNGIVGQQSFFLPSFHFLQWKIKKRKKILHILWLELHFSKFILTTSQCDVCVTIKGKSKFQNNGEKKIKKNIF